MKVANIQFSPWDRMHKFGFSDLDLNVNDYVIVKTEVSTELGKVIDIEDVSDEESKKLNKTDSIVRKATRDDLDKVIEKEKDKEEALKVCKELVDKYNLEMKLVDVHFSFDGGRITYAFIADGRIDFRELVKDLTRHFQKSIRLQQLGIRDEIRFSGDVGSCGRELCCQKFLKELKSVTSELGETQQVAHRGSDRLSGVCGRLHCCLAYEQGVYEEINKKLPAIGSKVRTKQGKGEVVGWHTLRQSIDVLLEDGETVIEVPVNK